MKHVVPLVALAASWLSGAPAQESAALKLAKTIPLPGVKGRFDHFAVDAQGGRLFVAALGNNTLEVLDMAAGKHLKSITGLHKPTGVVFLPDLNQIGVANGADGSFKLFDGASYQLANNLPGLDDADNVRRDARTKLIYVGYGNGALAILDNAGRQKLGEVKLPAHPESFQLESGGPRIFVNVPDAKQIAVIDREKKGVGATWPMEKYQANFPMALDEGNHRLFVGCRKPARLVVFDTAGGQPVADHAISGDPDDLFYDAKHKRIYTSCGDGFIDVIGQSDRDHYETLGKIPTRVGARTSFFSAEMNRFYLAVSQRDNDAAEIRVFEVQE
jgi:DNA-binding beta-propeller fold protein YncE